MNNSKNLSSYANAIRILSAEAVERAQSGHPGMPLGFADVFTSLAFNHMNFNPQNPNWFNRDRLILSAGHGSMLLYSFYYLAGYKDFSLNDIKNFRQLNSRSAGHPEKHLYDAIEFSSGPLGQGVASSVGIAIAAKKAASTCKGKIANHNIYAIVGDGCLMEGVSYEALSLAGHLGLDNLIILFDDNNISIDGSVDLCFSENHKQKMQSFGFDYFEANGHDFDEIDNVIQQAKLSKKPSFISFKTKIAKYADGKEGSNSSHGAPLGKEIIVNMRDKFGFSQEEFSVPQNILDGWRGIYDSRVKSYEDEWNNEFDNLSDDEALFMQSIMNHNYDMNLNLSELDLQNLINITESEASRASSGRIIESILKSNNNIIIGSADLASSNSIKSKEVKVINKNDFSGNFIYYGIREHAMTSITNGISIYGMHAFGASFLVFSDYMRPAIRLAALMNLPVRYIFTHDSIGVGEDGPTHQPIEHLASLKLIPNLMVCRPCNLLETGFIYKMLESYTKNPAVISLSRQKITQQFENCDLTISLDLVSKGGYIISRESNSSKAIDLVIIASGSEVEIALNIKKYFIDQDIDNFNNLNIRVISLPCEFIFAKQNKDYINMVLGQAKQYIFIEAASRSSFINSLLGDKKNVKYFTIENMFGKSAKAKDLYQEFGINVHNIIKSIELECV